MSNNSTYFVYTGQPFIGEAIIHLLLAFNNMPDKDGRFAPAEGEHSQIAYALIMISLESIIKAKLNEIDGIEPSKIEDLFKRTIDAFTIEHGGFELWNELKIVRNHIIHSAYFETSRKGGHISKATLKKLESSYYQQFLDLPNECTKKWKLSINPLNISRYEPLVGLLFFYWYGKETGVWQSNNPIHTPEIDCRMKYNIHDNWISRDDYHHLVGYGNDFIRLIAFLSDRLPVKQRKTFINLADEAFCIDIASNLEEAKSILSMFRNERNGIEEGSA
jgi:hypothetical protein